MLDRAGEDFEGGVGLLLAAVELSQRIRSGDVIRPSLQELIQLALRPRNVALGRRTSTRT